ncbi:hypothetical protein ACWEPC_37975 [Nonomuraea sp. NPDC004297]
MQLRAKIKSWFHELSAQSPKAPARKVPAEGPVAMAGLALTAGLGGLIYTGWSYTDAKLGVFHVSADHLGYGPHEYAIFALKSIPWWALAALPVPVVIALLLAPVRVWAVGKFKVLKVLCRSTMLGALLLGGGLTTLLLREWLDQRLFGEVTDVVVLALVCLGMVCVVWPFRAKHPLLFGLSMVVTAVLAVVTMAEYGAIVGKRRGDEIVANPSTGEVVEIMAARAILPSRFGHRTLGQGAYPVIYRNVVLLAESRESIYVLAGAKPKGGRLILDDPVKAVRLTPGENIQVQHRVGDDTLQR